MIDLKNHRKLHSEANIFDFILAYVIFHEDNMKNIWDFKQNADNGHTCRLASFCTLKRTLIIFLHWVSDWIFYDEMIIKSKIKNNHMFCSFGMKKVNIDKNCILHIFARISKTLVRQNQYVWCESYFNHSQWEFICTIFMCVTPFHDYMCNIYKESKGLQKLIHHTEK